MVTSFSDSVIIANLSIFPNYFFSLIVACTMDSVTITIRFIEGYISLKIGYYKNPSLSAFIIKKTKAGTDKKGSHYGCPFNYYLNSFETKIFD